ncbi:outer membrane beta-barrel domain-containing protein [Geomonas oryzisoli]|uniref:Outer membrane beta-barrel domain-containing protein n=1 Tax=Geomonas oryzisoli TaxID=2847992 RepID=A0ABX8J734_9BACT|nr:OmpA family protein [Geomonas oryzisoli]QWV93816.1 outer membrane beta-barrel domain-containing protein [Geomonas oryzisoli]
MKKYLLLLVLVPALLFTLLPQARAEIKAQSFSLSPFVGGYTFIGKEHLETAPAFGVRGGYNLTQHFGLEAVFDYVPTEGKRNSNIGDLDAYNYHLDMLYHFLPDRQLVPYVAAGYGGQSREAKGNFETSRPAFNYGVGLKYFLTDALALRGDLRHLILREDGESFHNLEYSVGVDFVFGGVKAAPAVAAKPEPAPPAPAPAEEPPLEPVPAAEPTPGHYKYCVTLHGEFDIDKAAIRQEDKDQIGVVCEFMKQYPTTTAVIEGHTDNVGAPEYNLGLSKRRAEAVVDYMVASCGIDRSRLEARGFGMARPVASNATDEGRQANRRIEAIIDCAFDVKEVKPPERLCMALVVEFDTGKANIKPQYKDEMAKVADYMKKYPTTTAVIEGHTDNVGGYEYNMKLSRERAESAVQYLVDNFGIEKSRLAAKGYGYTRRIAYNSTAEGRAKNRRINAIIDCVVTK